LHNSLQLDSVRSALAYSAFAAAFFFIMTVVAFGQTPLRNVPTVCGQALKTEAKIDVIERNSIRSRVFAAGFDLAHPAKLCSLAGPRRLS
jgi:hypothetical protein